MFVYLNQKRAQSTLEYAVLIIIIVAALLSIQMYIKRGVQGRLKTSTDDIGDQFSPDNTNAIKTTATHRHSTDQAGLAIGGTAGQGKTTSTIDQESTNTTDKSIILKTNQEYWGTTE